MSNAYVNAPATKLLATACACCGRALVDAVSVETGIGPECRKRFGTDVVVEEAARIAANVLVHAVAKRGVRRVECREICQKLAALGFVVLAARIMKRFRMVLAPVVTGPTQEELAAELAKLRAEYARIRADFTYDNSNARQVDAACRKYGAATPAEFVEALEHVECPCGRCAGTGQYIIGTENGAPKFGGGECFRCQGKGRQNLVDARRNRAYDAYQMSRALRATG